LETLVTSAFLAKTGKELDGGRVRRGRRSPPTKEGEGEIGIRIGNWTAAVTAGAKARRSRNALKDRKCGKRKKKAYFTKSQGKTAPPTELGKGGAKSEEEDEVWKKKARELPRKNSFLGATIADGGRGKLETRGK